MEIATFLIVGLIAGWLAGVVVKGHGLGPLGDVIVGIIGSFVSRFVFHAMGVTTYGYLGAVVIAAIGAIVLLFVVGLFTRERAQREVSKENKSSNYNQDHRFENAYDGNKTTARKVYGNLKRESRDAIGNESIVKDTNVKIDNTTNRIKNS